MALSPDDRRFRRLNTPEKRNTALRTALNNLIGAAQRRDQDPATFIERLAWAERLLRAGADPTQATEPSGLTLLHWAVSSDCVEMARLLMRYGADPAKKDRQRLPASALDRARDNVDRSQGVRSATMLAVLEQEGPVLREQWALRQDLDKNVPSSMTTGHSRPRL